MSKKVSKLLLYWIFLLKFVQAQSYLIPGNPPLKMLRAGVLTVLGVGLFSQAFTGPRNHHLFKEIFRQGSIQRFILFCLIIYFIISLDSPSSPSTNESSSELSPLEFSSLSLFTNLSLCPSRPLAKNHCPFHHNRPILHHILTFYEPYLQNQGGSLCKIYLYRDGTFYGENTKMRMKMSLTLYKLLGVFILIKLMRNYKEIITNLPTYSEHYMYRNTYGHSERR